MFYFVPAWYAENEWKENEQTWHVRRERSEMDDTVKQIQLFHRSHAYPYRILLLGYSPDLRHFLHRQSSLRAPYWSCFDAIQEVSRSKPAILSFHDLNWPENIEFTYSPFVVLALLNGQKYAQVEFGEDGNPIRVDMFDGGMLSRQNIYDDRGFLSCTRIFEKGKLSHEQYLNEKGVWKICRFADDHVVINPKSSTYVIRRGGKEISIAYRKSSYRTMEALIAEVLDSYLEGTDSRDIFCAAMHRQHTHLLREHLKGRKTVLSFFGNRINDLNDPDVIAMMRSADRIVIDFPDQRVKIEAAADLPENRIVNIPPYDARVDHGISQQLHVQNILVAVDGIGDDLMEKIVAETAAYMQQNDRARVVFFTRRPEYNREKKLLEKTQNMLKRHGFRPDMAAKEAVYQSEDMLEEGSVPILYTVKQCVDELSASRCIREQRLIIDLGQQADLFLQINAISMGIPQIGMRQTQYLVDGKNGRVNRDAGDLTEDIDFYLGKLGNWNEAMIEAYRIGGQFTTASLLNRWKEVIEEIGHGESTSAGN